MEAEGVFAGGLGHTQCSARDRCEGELKLSRDDEAEGGLALLPSSNRTKRRAELTADLERVRGLRDVGWLAQLSTDRERVRQLLRGAKSRSRGMEARHATRAAKNRDQVMALSRCGSAPQRRDRRLDTWISPCGGRGGAVGRVDGGADECAVAKGSNTPALRWSRLEKESESACRFH